MVAVEDAGRAGRRRSIRPFGYTIAAMAICVGLAVAPVHGVAWADSTGSESTGSESTGSQSTGSESASSQSAPSRDAAGPSDRTRPSDRTEPKKPDTDVGETESNEDSGTAKPVADVADRGESGTGVADSDPTAPTVSIPGQPVIPDTAVAEPDPVTTQDDVVPEAGAPDRDEHVVSLPVARSARATREEGSSTPVSTPAVGLLTADVQTAQREPAELTVAAQTDTSAQTDTAALAVVAAASSTAVEIATPSPPKPLSPLAELLQLPGRLVNAVLDVFDFTSYANSPRLPIGLGPINDLIFGAFRELERLVGLHQTPPVQPVVPALTYTGPTTRPTPTVAQFLNASAAGYVLGSTPGGLVPFTVNGFQLSSTNIFSGMVGKAWVTPEGQIIIGYQGTTGGSHLLFNPLITISQVLADLQVVFTGTTPLAFHDALRFANLVQAEAVLQGYTSDDIFVTGHSLGGWEAQFVAQHTGLAGIGFESPGINTVVPGNGADSMFVNIGTYGSSAPYMSTDLPGLQPFMPPYVPGGGSKPHYGPIVMIGDPAAMTPLYNASTLWGTSPIGSAIFLVDYLMNFFQYHLPGVQAYHLDVTPDPGVALFLGTARGPVHTGYGTLTIPQLMRAASDDGILFRP